MAFRERISAIEDEFLSPLAQRSYPARREGGGGRLAGAHPVPTRPRPHRPTARPSAGSSTRRRCSSRLRAITTARASRTRSRPPAIARTVSRALGLNEDLTEAIGLGHDLGHAPFGHIRRGGARRLPLNERYGLHFRHNRHSLRVVERLERDGQGLNLTDQVRDGILRHTGDELPATQEGRILRLWTASPTSNHDIERCAARGFAPDRGAASRRDRAAGRHGLEAHRTLVRDLVERSSEAGDIVQSEDVGGAMDRPAHVHVRARPTWRRPRSGSIRASSACCARCSSTWWRTRHRPPRPTPPTPTV